MDGIDDIYWPPLIWDPLLDVQDPEEKKAEVATKVAEVPQADATTAATPPKSSKKDKKRKPRSSCSPPTPRALFQSPSPHGSSPLDYEPSPAPSEAATPSRDEAPKEAKEAHQVIFLLVHILDMPIMRHDCTKVCLLKVSEKPLIRTTSKQLRAYEAKLRRMCTKSAKRGSLKVTAEIAEKWKCGKSRKQLLNVLVGVQGDKDFFSVRLYHTAVPYMLPAWLYYLCMRRTLLAVAWS